MFACGLGLLCRVKPHRRTQYVCSWCILSPLRQEPIPEAVTPSRGPKAGGTLLTITGVFLDTGSKEDVRVSVGAVDCIV